MATRFKYTDKFDGKYLGNPVLHMNAVRSLGALKVFANKTHIYLKPVFPIILIQKPLSIPIDDIVVDNAAEYLFDGYRFTVKGINGVYFYVNKIDYIQLKENLKAL